MTTGLYKRIYLDKAFYGSREPGPYRRRCRRQMRKRLDRFNRQEIATALETPRLTLDDHERLSGRRAMFFDLHDYWEPA
jgi:hypothetical protein